MKTIMDNRREVLHFRLATIIGFTVGVVMGFTNYWFWIPTVVFVTVYGLLRRFVH